MELTLLIGFVVGYMGFLSYCLILVVTNESRVVRWS